MKIKITKLATTIVSLVLILAPALVFAQSADEQARCKKFQSQFSVTIGNQAPVNISDGLPSYCTASGLILTIINYGLAISGTITILFLMVGGFWYLTSAGNEEQVEKGQKTITNSVIGLVVIILAFAIVRIVSSTLSLGK